MASRGSKEEFAESCGGVHGVPWKTPPRGYGPKKTTEPPHQPPPPKKPANHFEEVQFMMAEPSRRFQDQVDYTQHERAKLLAQEAPDAIVVTSEYTTTYSQNDGRYPLYTATISAVLTRNNISRRFREREVGPVELPYKTSAEGSELNSSLFDVVPFASDKQIWSLNRVHDETTMMKLVRKYSRTSHMAVLDPSYHFFSTDDGDVGLYFKVRNKICLVSGGPLCQYHIIDILLQEFKTWPKLSGLGIIFVGACDDFAKGYAKQAGWFTLQFGVERVINPMSNPVLLEQRVKRLITQNRQLLNKDKGRLTIAVYNPGLDEKDKPLEELLTRIYHLWRKTRNEEMKGNCQAFVTVYEPFSTPGQKYTVFLYVKDEEGIPCGFAALRRLGDCKSFHIDPYIAGPGAKRGITDLLIYASMVLLNTAGIGYLSLGFEPLPHLGEINNVRKWLQNPIRKSFTYILKELPLGGKKAFHDKWYLDETLGSGLHLVFPDGLPGYTCVRSVLKFCHIDMKELFAQKWNDYKARGEEEATEKERERSGKKGYWEEFGHLCNAPTPPPPTSANAAVGRQQGAYSVPHRSRKSVSPFLNRGDRGSGFWSADSSCGHQSPRVPLRIPSRLSMMSSAASVWSRFPNT